MCGACICLLTVVISTYLGKRVKKSRRRRRSRGARLNIWSARCEVLRAGEGRVIKKRMEQPYYKLT